MLDGELRLRIIELVAPRATNEHEAKALLKVFYDFATETDFKPASNLQGFYPITNPVTTGLS